MYTYFFYRLEYSILVACDYYATTEFNSGFEMDCFGKADASKFREIYERSHLMESIRKYGKESYPRKKWDGKEKINILRNELFLEAEEKSEGCRRRLYLFCRGADWKRKKAIWH